MKTKHISELERSLSVHLSWNKSRIGCLARMILAMIAVRTVNLVDIACAFGGGKTKALSSYRRLQRFFSGYDINYAEVAGVLFGLFAKDQKVYLSMDRTQWQWGKSPINILMLSLVHKGTAVPIYWSMIDSKGNSNTQARIELVNRFVRQFGKGCLAGLLCDREFVGKEWFAYLKSAEIPFFIRIKNNSVTTNSRGQIADVWTLFLGLKHREERVLRGARKVYGIDVFLVGIRCDDGEQLIVATHAEEPQAINIYRRRWEVETLFGCLKGRGFRFEDTHITDLERIKKLTAVLALAFAWAHRIGEWRHENHRPIKIKNHGRMAISWFRYGLDFIREILFAGKFSGVRFRQCLRQLQISKAAQKNELITI